MKILFLDDSLERTKTFTSRIPYCETFLNASSIIGKFKNCKDEFDIVFLDHDLEGTFQNSREENCGMEVVRHICKHRPLIKNIIVHSLNYPAAQEMVRKLQDSRYKARYCSFLALASGDNIYNIIKQCN